METTRNPPANGFTPGPSARVISDSHKSRPYWGIITPRWICRMLQDGHCVPIDGGRFRLNRVAEPILPTHTAVAARLSDRLPEQHVRIVHSQPEDATIPGSYATFEEDFRTIPLEPIQQSVRINVRNATLYADNYCQVRQQVYLTSQFLYESTENLIFNHPEYGLLHNTAPDMYIRSDHGPSPDLLDDMLSRCWRSPDCYLMHPEALESFHRTASAAGITTLSKEMMGSYFTTWRGIPILPSNKLHLTVESDTHVAPRASTEMVTTHVCLLRLGEAKQGVISLYAARAAGTEEFPFINIDFMGIDNIGVASYLMSTYRAMAVLTPSALCTAEVQISGPSVTGQVDAQRQAP
jgi:hypothetical protein